MLGKKKKKKKIGLPWWLSGKLPADARRTGVTPDPGRPHWPRGR